MHVELRPITSIRAYENNPRLNAAAVEAVAASIRSFSEVGLRPSKQERPAATALFERGSTFTL